MMVRRTIVHAVITNGPLFAAVSLSVLFWLSIACGTSTDGPGGRRASDDSWDYAIRLGDSRAKVHKLLGNAARTTDALEEYPKSGVTVWFDSEGRASKLNFGAEADQIYVGASEWIPSDRQLMFGLSTRMNEDEFTRVLGTPVRVHEHRVPPTGGASVPASAGPDKYFTDWHNERRVIWRKLNYSIEARFLASDRADQGKTFAKGSLLDFEISPGL